MAFVAKLEVSPRTKEILKIIGLTGLVVSSLLVPGLPGAFKYFEKKSDRYRLPKEWKRYNLRLLKRNIKRLLEQQIIKFEERGEETVLKLTDKGKLRVIRFDFECLSLKPVAKWDGKWRLIIYDVKKGRKREQDMLRSTLKRLKCLHLQKSVFLTPHMIEEEIEFLRTYLDLRDSVLLLTINKLENEQLYKDFFGI